MKKVMSQQMRAMAKIHHLMFLLEKRADQILAEHSELSFMQALILNIIRHHPNTTQSFIGQCTRFTPGAISRQMEVLREKGMLTREVKQENRREHEITLTKKGSEVVEKAFTNMDKELASMFAGLETNEYEALEEIISKLIHKIDPEYYKFEENAS